MIPETRASYTGASLIGKKATMDNNSAALKASWRQRQAALGSTRRSVLYKNFPDFLNSSLHKRHVRFILDQLGNSPQYLLDLGCGYGRISAEIIKRHPHSTIQGVEFCDEFARQFEQDIGECALQTIQEYEQTRQYDVILCITVLMYVSPPELAYHLDRYWQALRPGGQLICIEPCENIINRLRRASNSKTLSPTGGDLIHYFDAGELAGKLLALPNARLLQKKNFGVLPLFPVPRLHEGFAVEKLAAR